MIVQPGRVLAGYRIDRLLGSGALGTVYQAHDPTLDRAVAIKVLNLSVADPQDAERFRAEARVLARFSHPHILPVFAAGIEQGVPYLVTALASGGALDAWLGRGPIRAANVVHVLRPIADALDAIHQEGVVHRDVKPQNILLDAHGRPLLADFGIAKLLTGATTLTVRGEVLGTPAYMAPEYVRGLPVTPATDRYALAVVAYELLVGQQPYPGHTGIQQLLAHANGPLPRPRQVHPVISTALEAVLLRGLARDPAQRFARAVDLIAAIDAASAPSSTSQPPPTPGAAQSPARRPRKQPRGAGTHGQISRAKQLQLWRAAHAAALYSPGALALLEPYRDLAGAVTKNVGYASRAHIRSLLDDLPARAGADQTPHARSAALEDIKCFLRAHASPGARPLRLAMGIGRETVSPLSLAHAYQIVEHYEIYCSLPYWWHRFTTPTSASLHAAVEPAPPYDEADFCGAPSTHGMRIQAGLPAGTRPTAVVQVTLDGSGRPPDLKEAVASAPAGSVIVLGAGVHRLAGPLLVARDLMLVGAGSETTTISCDAAGYVVGFTGPGRFTARDLTFRHDGTGGGADGLVVRDGTVLLAGCRFAGARFAGRAGGAGLRLLGRTSGMVCACEAVENALIGIMVTDAAAPTLERNTCVRNGSAGIGYWGDAAGMARANSCGENVQHGILVAERARPTLEGNICERNHAIGIGYWDDARGAARANTCSENGLHGIHVAARAAPSLEGNLCRQNVWCGIAYEGEASGVARANTCAENGRQSIYLGTRAKATLVGNTC